MKACQLPPSNVKWVGWVGNPKEGLKVMVVVDVSGGGQKYLEGKV